MVRRVLEGACQQEQADVEVDAQRGAQQRWVRQLKGVGAQDVGHVQRGTERVGHTACEGQCQLGREEPDEEDPLRAGTRRHDSRARVCDARQGKAGSKRPGCGGKRVDAAGRAVGHAEDERQAKNKSG